MLKVVKRRYLSDFLSRELRSPLRFWITSDLDISLFLFVHAILRSFQVSYFPVDLLVSFSVFFLYFCSHMENMWYDVVTHSNEISVLNTLHTVPLFSSKFYHLFHVSIWQLQCTGVALLSQFIPYAEMGVSSILRYIKLLLPQIWYISNWMVTDYVLFQSVYCHSSEEYLVPSTTNPSGIVDVKPFAATSLILQVTSIQSSSDSWRLV